MYAIISDRGRQTTLRVGDIVDLDLNGAESGSKITLDRVLLVGGEGGVRLGTPTVNGASVTAEVLDTVKGKKVFSLRYRRRKNIRVKHGHRTKSTRVKVTAING